MLFPGRVAINTMDGREVDFNTQRKKDAPVSPVVGNDAPPVHQNHQRSKSLVRMETVEAEKTTGKSKRKRARKAEKQKKATEEREEKAGKVENALATSPSALVTARRAEGLGHTSYSGEVAGQKPGLGVYLRKEYT